MTHYKIKTAAGREFRVYSPNLDAVQRTAKKLVRNGDSVEEIKEADPRDWTGNRSRYRLYEVTEVMI